MALDPSDEELRIQEESLVFSSFTNDDAIALGMRLIDAGRAESLAITVDVRRGDQQLFHAGLAGTSADNDAWVERKVRLVKRVGMSSYRMGCQLRATGRSLGEALLLDEREYAAHGGAFPIVVANVGLVGVVTVSGLPQREDHALVVRVLTEWLKAAG
jgi:uncharacterized protein (UPF0303 family)